LKVFWIPVHFLPWLTKMTSIIPPQHRSIPSCSKLKPSS
jgi:hypothetical protein